MVLQAWGLSWCRSNAIKYLCRAGHKEGNDELLDLEKAAEYIRREIGLVRQRRGTK